MKLLRAFLILCQSAAMTSTPLPPGQWVPAPDIPGIPEVLRTEGAYLPGPLPAHLTLPAATYRRAARADHRNVRGRVGKSLGERRRGPTAQIEK